jgi:S1-C subfamily serine protease
VFPGPGYPSEPQYSAPPAGYASSGSPPVSGYPVTPPPPRRRSWPGVFAFVLALLLAIVAGVEGFLLYDVNQRLDRASRQATVDRTNDESRLAGLDKRASELEKQIGNQFNPAAVAAATLPSVFRVAAGDFTGTAFAIGRQPSSGGTYLLTNNHVVEQVWGKGSRQVFLERREQRFPATILKVDKENDVALLETKEKFPRLASASAAAKSGEQIMVVGAPLGFEDSVTTGVVSAFRKLPDFASEMMQFDAAINPGNSGGPVISSQKQVVGIATAKARDSEGIGLAVPIAVACDLMDIC